MFLSTSTSRSQPNGFTASSVNALRDFGWRKAQEENQIIRNVNEYYSSDVPLRNLTWGNAQTHLYDCPQEVC